MPEFHTDLVQPKSDHVGPVGSGLYDRYKISSMDELVQRLALMALIKKEDVCAAAKPSPVSQVYRLFPAKCTPMIRSNGFNTGYHEVKRGHNVSHIGNMPSHVTPTIPVQHYTFAKPFPSDQVDISMKMNDMIHLPGEQPMYVQSCPLPFQGARIRFGAYLPGDRGGTGVFIPRVTNYHAMEKKGPRYMMPAGVAKQEQRQCHSQAVQTDLGLPKEWTY